MENIASKNIDLDHQTKKILKRFEALAAERAGWENIWQELAEYVLPREAGFTSGSKISKRQTIFDSTAPLALERLAAILESALTPRAEKWHKLKTGFTELDNDPEIATYLEEVTDILFMNRYRAESNFSNQINEAYMSLGVFGSAVIFVDDKPGEGLIYKNFHLSEFYFGENSWGNIDTVVRAYSLSARQAYEEFGNNLPEEILNDCLNEKNLEKKHDFFHMVAPNMQLDESKADWRGMAYSSYHVSKAYKSIVRFGGYRVMPYAISRYQTAPGDVYGRSPALTVLADIKQVNEMERTLMRAGQKAVDPPLLLPDDDLLNAFSLKAGALNYGGLSEDGRQRVVPLITGANIALGYEMLQQKRKTINDAFMVTLFQIMVDKPGMSATEVLQRSQDKWTLLGPVIGRQQAELLAPLIKRELDLLIARGALPEPPLRLKSRIKKLDISYESPITQSQKYNQARVMLESFSMLEPIIKINPQLLSLFHLEEVVKSIALNCGLSPKIFNDTNKN